MPQENQIYFVQTDVKDAIVNGNNAVKEISVKLNVLNGNIAQICSMFGELNVKLQSLIQSLSGISSQSSAPIVLVDSSTSEIYKMEEVD